MKLNSLISLNAFALAGSALFAGQLTVSIDGFSDPTGFSITSTDTLALRVTELVPAADTNTSTHVLIEGLSPLEDGTSVYASTYSGINVDSGATQDMGVLFLEMPQGSSLPEGTVASPIVGVVQRSGSWADFSLSFPETSIGGSAGAGDYETGSLNMTLIRNAEVFTGSTTYTVLDVDTISVEPFTLLKDGVSSYDLSGGTLLRDGDRFYGTLTNLSDGAAYDSLLFSIAFSEIPDLDLDGIPDISDDSVVAGLTPAVWNITEIGYVYGYTANWGYSIFMGYVYMDLPYIYQVPFGWLYLADSFANVGGGNSFWFYSTAMGWVFANDTYGGFFQSENSGWQYDNFLNPNP